MGGKGRERMSSPGNASEFCASDQEGFRKLRLAPLGRRGMAEATHLEYTRRD